MINYNHVLPLIAVPQVKTVTVITRFVYCFKCDTKGDRKCSAQCTCYIRVYPSAWWEKLFLGNSALTRIWCLATVQDRSTCCLPTVHEKKFSCSAEKHEWRICCLATVYESRISSYNKMQDLVAWQQCMMGEPSAWQQCIMADPVAWQQDMKGDDTWFVNSSLSLTFLFSKFSWCHWEAVFFFLLYLSSRYLKSDCSTVKLKKNIVRTCSMDTKEPVCEHCLAIPYWYNTILA